MRGRCHDELPGSDPSAEQLKPSPSQIRVCEPPNNAGGRRAGTVIQDGGMWVLGDRNTGLN